MMDRHKPNESLVLAVDAKQLGAMLGVSVRTIRMMDAAGKLPQPVVIGTRSVRWTVKNIERWLAAGCPDRRMWNALKGNEPR